MLFRSLKMFHETTFDCGLGSLRGIIIIREFQGLLPLFYYAMCAQAEGGFNLLIALLPRRL